MNSGKKTKVVFLGESVAAGFMYAPHYTPSIFLESLLKANGMICNVEDETKVSIEMPELIKKCVSAANNCPDYAIVFAGNNWRKGLWKLSEGESDRIYQAIQSGVKWYKAVGNVIQEKAAAQIDSFFFELKSLFSDKVLFVIPEFNLKDWRYNSYDTELNCPFGLSKQWRTLITDDVSEENAKKMISLDPVNPLGYEIIARIACKNGDNITASDMYNKALDTNLYRLGPPPAVNSIIKNSIRKAAQIHGIAVCDLPKVFAEYLEGGIPGNDLFIDYCHLTDTGIRVACTEIAKWIFKQQCCNLTVSSDLRPEQEISSHAHFYAAIHSAHIGNLDKDYLLYHCRKALNIQQEIAEKMIKYCKCASQKTPWRLNKLFTEINTAQYPTIRQPDDCMVMDIELVDVMMFALKEIGIDIHHEINDIRITNHAGKAPFIINLLETYYKESSYFNTFLGSKSVDYGDGKKMYSSFRTNCSNFYLIQSGVSDLTCDIIIKTPPYSFAEISISINEKHFYSVKAETTNWFKIEENIPAELLKRGVNKISIKWSNIAKPEENTFVTERLLFDYIRPIYGHIMQFIVKERKDVL